MDTGTMQVPLDPLISGGAVDAASPIEVGPIAVNQGEPALELRALTRHYGGSVAVAGVTLTVRAGEFVTLLGPSGSGKTTTLKMIAGFETPDSGAILLRGTDITAAEPNQRNIGMVFQNYALFPHMTVFENIAFPLRMRRHGGPAIRDAVEKILRLVQMTDFAGRYPKQLSGGQQQRVALARALVFEPPLLLMDEPLGALDRQLRRQVQSEIKRIHRSLGVTIVFVTHDQDEAMFLSDRIAVMDRGRIAQQGPPAELYHSPTNRFVAEFVGDSNFLVGTVMAIRGDAVKIRLADGTIADGHAAETLAVDQTVDCLLRPEKIALQDGVSGHNTIQGRVELASFLGGAVELELSTRLGRMTVRQGIRSADAPYAVGQSVALSWTAADFRAFGKTS